VGYFLAQYQNQCSPIAGLLTNCPGEVFLNAYTVDADRLPADFPSQAAVFRARADLSIASYLVGVGKGESADLKRVVRDAERSLSNRSNNSSPAC
jgi:hypothetical protein